MLGREFKNCFCNEHIELAFGLLTLSYLHLNTTVISAHSDSEYWPSSQ